MHETRQDAWFYSRERERLGPVTFGDLAIKAKEGSLNPRHDLVWKYGMAEWTPAGEIEGLFEHRATPEPGKALPPAPDPSASSHESATKGPGARRRTYLLLILLVIVAVAAVVALMLGAVGSPELQEQIREMIRQGAEMIPQK